MKTVKEILAAKASEFNYISAKAKVIDALSLMKSTNNSYVIVMDDDRFEGIMTEKDYSQKVILVGKHSDELLIGDIMCKDFQTVNYNDSAFKCMQLMDTFKTLYLPVFSGHEFKGIITLNDLLKESVHENETGLSKEQKQHQQKENFYYWI